MISKLFFILNLFLLSFRLKRMRSGGIPLLSIDQGIPRLCDYTSLGMTFLVLFSVY